MMIKITEYDRQKTKLIEAGFKKTTIQGCKIWRKRMSQHISYLCIDGGEYQDRKMCCFEIALNTGGGDWYTFKKFRTIDKFIESSNKSVFQY